MFVGVTCFFPEETECQCAAVFDTTSCQELFRVPGFRLVQFLSADDGILVTKCTNALDELEHVAQIWSLAGELLRPINLRFNIARLILDDAVISGFLHAALVPKVCKTWIGEEGNHCSAVIKTACWGSFAFWGMKAIGHSEVPGYYQSVHDDHPVYSSDECRFAFVQTNRDATYNTHYIDRLPPNDADDHASSGAANDKKPFPTVFLGILCNTAGHKQSDTMSPALSTLPQS